MINGGYFSGSSPLSLALVDGERLADNVAAVTRQGKSLPVLRSALWMSEDGRAQIGWVGRQCGFGSDDSTKSRAAGNSQLIAWIAAVSGTLVRSVDWKEAVTSVHSLVKYSGWETIMKYLIGAAGIVALGLFWFTITSDQDRSQWGVQEVGKTPPTRTGAEEMAAREVAETEGSMPELDAGDDLGRAKVLQQRGSLQSQIVALANCGATYSCPEDTSDPRASDLLLGKKLAEMLAAYAELHRQNGYYDAQSAEMARNFIDHADGFVQEAALNLMSIQPPDKDSAVALINAMKSSYDAKIMKQAMQELQRYPDLQIQVDRLLANSLQTGSLYVAQEVALNILPHLNAKNYLKFQSIAEKLPQNSQRARALKSNLREFRLRNSGG